MRSWIPRAPSARLTQSLFGGGAPQTAPPATRPAVLLWLTPATCVLLLSLAFWMMRGQTPGYRPPAGGTRMLASISLPGGNSMTYDAANTHDQTWNVWSVATLDWSRGARFLSNTGSFLLKTNLQRL